MGRRSRLDDISRQISRSGRGRSRQRDSSTKLEPVRQKTALARSDSVDSYARHSTTNTKDPRYIAIRKVITAALHAEFPFAEHGEKPPEELKKLMRSFLQALVRRPSLGAGSLNRDDRETMVEQVLANQIGLGPLEPILGDPTITDIMINGPDNIYFERKGKLQKSHATFDSDEQLINVIRRIIAQVGRRVDEQNAMVDARMLDGSRFNAIIPPLALDGAAVSIRRFGVPIKAEQLVAWGAMPQPMMDFLSACVRSKKNTVISGGTGSGKTTLLNVLSSFIPSTERVITIEDSAELQLQQDHVVRLESRPMNTEGTGEISQGDLLTHSLRMRPDRVILGEIRGAEAVDMLQAMNSGNAGSMATVHSNSPQDALSRFETMVGIGMPNMGERFIRSLIASALDVIIQLNRLSDGTRRCTAISEIMGMENGFIITRDLFLFNMLDTVDGQVIGRYEATGLAPSFFGEMVRDGIAMDKAVFREFKLDVGKLPEGS